MKVVPVAEFKARLSDLLDLVRSGETVVVSFGRNHVPVAALVPIDQVQPHPSRRLGVLAGQAAVRFAEDFAMDDEAFLRA